MNTKIVLGILAAVIIIGGGYYFYTNKQASAPTTNTTQQPSSKIVPKWTFENVANENESDAPRTKVTLTVGDKTYDAGTYQGTCAEIGASGGVDSTGLLAGEASGVQCWFAGGGDEIGFWNEEDGSHTIKHGELGEPDGEGASAFRGNFKDIVTL